MNVNTFMFRSNKFNDCADIDSNPDYIACENEVQKSFLICINDCSHDDFFCFSNCNREYDENVANCPCKEWGSINSRF